MLCRPDADVTVLTDLIVVIAGWLATGNAMGSLWKGLGGANRVFPCVDPAGMIVFFPTAALPDASSTGTGMSTEALPP